MNASLLRYLNNFFGSYLSVIGCIGVGSFVTLSIYSCRHWLHNLLSRCRNRIRYSNTENSAHKRSLPPGLRNYGSNCYLNVILQALGNLNSFRTFIENMPKMPSRKRTTDFYAETHGKNGKNSAINNPVLEPVKSCMEYLWRSAGSVDGIHHPFPLMEILQSRIPHFNLHEQQDALEIFTYMAGAMTDDIDFRRQTMPEEKILSQRDENIDDFLVRNLNSSPVNIENAKLSVNEEQAIKDIIEKSKALPFTGVSRITLTCQVCGRKTFKAPKEINSIIVSVMTESFDESAEREGRGQNCDRVYGLEACIKDYFKEDTIEDFECCGEGCKLLSKLEHEIKTGTINGNTEAEINQFLQDIHSDFRESYERRWRDIKKYELGFSKFSENVANTPLELPPVCCTHKTEMVRAPEVLCVQIQRRFYDKDTFQERKLTNKVDFELEMKLPFQVNGKFTGETYRLSSVVVHRGRFFSYGHYVIYMARWPEDNQSSNHRSNHFLREINYRALNFSTPEEPNWVCVSDETITQVEFDEVQNQAAYMFFYERVSGDHKFEVMIEN